MAAPDPLPPEQVETLDNILMGVASQVGPHGGIVAVLHQFFGFLHRKTDFYVVDPAERRPMGFDEGVAEKLLLREFHRYPMKRVPAAEGHAAPSAPAAGGVAGSDKVSTKKGKGKKGKGKGKGTSAASAASMSGVSVAGAGSGGGSTDAPALPTPASSSAGSSASGGDSAGGEETAASDGGRVPGIRYTDKGKQIPVGNGGVCPNYWWTQQLKELTVYVDVPPGTKPKEIICDIKAGHMKVGVKGQPLIIDGDFEAKVKASECMWDLEERKTLCITLDKVVHTWWKTVIQGDPEIDAQKVDSTMRVDEYDPEAQATIRKIMFDQQRKATGLPTSDEIQAQEMMRAAMDGPGSPFAPPGAGAGAGGAPQGSGTGGSAT